MFVVPAWAGVIPLNDIAIKDTIGSPRVGGGDPGDITNHADVVK